MKEKLEIALISLIFGYGITIFLFILAFLVKSFISFEFEINSLIETKWFLLRGILIVGLLLSIIGYMALEF